MPIPNCPTALKSSMIRLEKVGRPEGSCCRDILQRPKTFVGTRNNTQGQNHNMCTHMKMLRVHVPGICCSDMSLHVPSCCDFVCNISPLCDPNECRLSVYYTPFCRCNMSLQHEPSCLPTLTQVHFFCC